MNTHKHISLFVKLAIFFGCITAVTLRLPVHTLAQTPEPTVTSKVSEVTPTSKPSTVNKTIETLKEKIEDKVDEINKKTKKVIKGTVSEIKDSIVTLQSSDGKEYSITMDDTVTTVFSSSLDGFEEIEQTEIAKDDYILATGPVIENQVSANAIYKQDQYLVLQGQITAVDKDKFTVSIVTQTKDQYTLDIEKATTQFIMDSKDLTLSKAGFSKYKAGDRIHTVILKSEEKDPTASAIRTLIIPQEYFSKDTIIPSKAN